MKRFSLLFLSAIFGFGCTFAQNGTGFVGNGYYRISNLITQRYIYVTDNKDYYEKNQDVGDFQAIQLWKDYNRTISDPASVIFIKNISGDRYDLMAQATGVHNLTGYYVTATKQSNGTYEVSATVSKAGLEVTKYLSDDEHSTTRAKGKMGTNSQGNYRKWIVDKLETNHETNYFGITPTIELDGKYYQPFYADFPFKAVSADMHIYYVSDENGEQAFLQEIEGEVPASTPVIIECASANPSQNRLELLVSSSAKVTGNKLGGIYFCNGGRPEASKDAYKIFDPATMRVFSVADDKLVLTNNAPDRLKEMSVVDWSDPWQNKITVKCLYANTSYFKASASTPDELTVRIKGSGINDFIGDKGQAVAGVYTISGTLLRTDNNLEGLPAGVYIIGGKKVVVK